MAIPVFILGGAGAGKTTAITYLQEYLHKRTIVKIDLFLLLKSYYEQDRQQQHTRPVIVEGRACGFIITDTVPYTFVEKGIQQQVEAVSSVDYACIEFACYRRDMIVANLDPDFLSRSLCLWIDADEEIRWQRVRERNKKDTIGHYIVREVFDRFTREEQQKFFDCFPKERRYAICNTRLKAHLWQDTQAFARWLERTVCLTP